MKEADILTCTHCIIYMSSLGPNASFFSVLETLFEFLSLPVAVKLKRSKSHVNDDLVYLFGLKSFLHSLNAEQ